MGRFHKTYPVNGDVDKCMAYISRYIKNRGYMQTQAYYGKTLFAANDSALPTVFGADNNMRFISVERQNELIVIEAWILNAWAVADVRSWTNPAFITKLDKNEIDPTEENRRFKLRKQDLLNILEDIQAISEEYNRRGTVNAALALPSGYCYAAECENLTDFLNSIAPVSIGKNIVHQCIFIYAMAFFAVVAAITTSMWTDIVQITLIVILAVVVHVKKSYRFANALFALCIAEVLLPFLFGSSSNWVTWLMLIDSYLMVNCFKTAGKMYLLGKKELG